MPAEGLDRAVDGVSTSTLSSKPIPEDGIADDIADNIVDGIADGIGGDRVAQLEREVAELREALVTRQLIGWVAGVVAERFGLTFEQAWEVLVRLSQNTNVKLRVVARVFADAYCGQLSADDQPLARQLDLHLSGGIEAMASDPPPDVSLSSSGTPGVSGKPLRNPDSEVKPAR